MSRNFTPEARERIRQAQAKRWGARAPFETKLIEKDGLEYAEAEDGSVYVLLRGQPIPKGCKSIGIHDHWAVFDRHGKQVVADITREQAERIRAELDAPFATGATP